MRYILAFFLVIGIIENSLAELNRQEVETNIKPSQTQQTKSWKPKYIYPFYFDRYFSPYAASSYYISTRSFFNYIEDNFCEKVNDYLLGRYMISIANNFLNSTLYVLNHEINGHGFRERSSNRQVKKYGLGISFVWASFIFPGIGLDGFTRYQENRHATWDSGLISTIAGNEANVILANEILMNNFHDKTMHKNNYNLFLGAFSNFFGYVLITNKHMYENKGDIWEWVQDINKKHQPTTKKITLNDVRLGTMVYTLNPIAYIGVYSWYHTIITGQKSYWIPSIRIGNVKYLPIIRMGLSPFGLIYHIDNFIYRKGMTLLINMNFGRSPFYKKTYWGGSIRSRNLLKYRILTLDIMGAFWYQPSLLLSLPIAEKLQLRKYDKFELGFLIGPKISINIHKNISIGLSAFYKTKGFVEGEIAQEGFGVRGGFVLKM